MTRHEAAERVFNYIRKNKFKPTNIQYGDGYCFFDTDKDMNKEDIGNIVHFDIKELHGWKFAMWIETDPEIISEYSKGYDDGKEYPALQFFCQHKSLIDKFKPSRSFFLVKFDLERIVSDDDWIFYDIREILQMIKRHPFIAFTMDACESSFYNKSYIGCYLDLKFYMMKKAIKKWCKDTWTMVWHGSKVWFISKYKIVDDVKLVDDINRFPRYDMRIHFKTMFDDEEKQQKAEVKILNIWFRKNYYENMNLELSRDGIEGIYCYPIKN